MEIEIAFRTLALALGVGLFLTVIAHKFDLPTIVLLFAGGLLLGPAGLSWIDPASLGNTLPAIVSLSIGIILFEGGLTLKPKDYLASPKIIKRLLTLGTLVTWFCAATAVYLFFDASWQISLLAGSLVIVTGPTVIVPMLHRLRLKSRIGSILHWEGVLIDAIGVFCAIFCYELVVLEGGTTAVGGFALRLGVGLAFGIIGGIAIQQCLERNWIPDSLTNPFALAAAVLVLASAELISHESGLLAVTVAGVIVGRRRSSEVRQIQAFKAEITDILIATLFLLLVSRLDPSVFLQDIWKLLLCVAVVMFLARPLNVFLSAIGSGLSGKEKLFLAWVAPRGIVAASMASLFTLQLSSNPEHAAEASLVETFVYTTICATVVIQGLTAGWWARKLGVSRGKANGWLIVGAHAFGRALAQAIAKNGSPILLVDSNQRNIDAARALGLEAALEDAREAEALRDDERFQNVGHLLALTDNTDLNELVASRWRPFIDRSKRFVWSQRTDTNASDDVATVFNDLPQPSIISEELEKGASRLHADDSPLEESQVPLLAFAKETITPLTRDDLPKNTKILRLTRQRSSLGLAIERGGIFPLEPQPNLDAVYERLRQEALRVEPRLDEAALAAELADFEHRASPIFGDDVSAHQIYSSVIEKSICLLARLNTPLTTRVTHREIEFIFLIISPSQDPEEPLILLSQLVALCHDHPALEAWASRQPTTTPHESE